MSQPNPQVSFLPLHPGPMDDAHREFLNLAEALLATEAGEEGLRLARVLSQCRSHFADEERWMRESAMTGTEAHCREHAEVLQQLEAAQAAVERGEAGAGCAQVRELLPWFQQHWLTLDAALAFNLQRSRSRKAVLSAVG